MPPRTAPAWRAPGLKPLEWGKTLGICDRAELTPLLVTVSSQLHHWPEAPGAPSILLLGEAHGLGYR